MNATYSTVMFKLKLSSSSSFPPPPSSSPSSTTTTPATMMGGASSSSLRVPVLATKITGPATFTPLYCSLLRLHQDVSELVTSIAHEVTRVGVCGGRHPTSVAAAIIYAVMLAKSLTSISLKQISDVARVTEGTIRNALKQIVEERSRVFPHDLADALALGASQIAKRKRAIA
eukprot:TRINITY_DN9808_c0_g1_i2.p1 TRINITY_DN9808_c0_g1~~TRINITY_DN9808_c0_g1_i2.p1  ORF type:complete len:173 (-),score=30.28 TRINITY_DN9808_c0_g1_i2:106-624(-)